MHVVGDRSLAWLGRQGSHDRVAIPDPSRCAELSKVGVQQSQNSLRIRPYVGSEQRELGLDDLVEVRTP